MEPWREELYHHGILGQKWGIRRYQNEDGSLTELGKRRLYKDARKSKKYNHWGNFYNPRTGKSLRETESFKIYESQVTTKKLRKLNKEYEQLTEHDRKFMNDEALINKYTTINGIVNGWKIGCFPPGDEETKKEFADVMLASRDKQNKLGMGQAFEYYLLDNGISPTDYIHEITANRDAYYREILWNTNKILGDYKDKPVKYLPNGYEYELTHVVQAALNKASIEEENKMPHSNIWMSRYKVDLYKDDLEDAKRYIKDHNYTVSDEELRKIVQS